MNGYKIVGSPPPQRFGLKVFVERGGGKGEWARGMGREGQVLKLRDLLKKSC